jgi:hypothetical protein
MMTQQKKKEKTSSPLQAKLESLEETAAQQGIRIHYDRLEAAGLKLQGGICKVRGEYHLFIDRRKPLAEKLDLLTGYLAAISQQ